MTVYNKTFSEALNLIKEGHLLARAGWNGKNMFVFLVQGSTFEVNRPPLNVIFPPKTVINYLPHVDMKTAGGEIVPWLVSQADLMAEDWGITGV